MCKNIEHQKNAYLDLYLVIFEDHLIFKLHFIRTIWLKMCLFVIRDAKNMFQENRESNVHAFQAHTVTVPAVLIHSCISFCSDIRETVSLRLWLLDATALDRTQEFNMLIYTEANLCSFWSMAHIFKSLLSGSPVSSYFMFYDPPQIPHTFL